MIETHYERSQAISRRHYVVIFRSAITLRANAIEAGFWNNFGVEGQDQSTLSRFQLFNME